MCLCASVRRLVDSFRAAAFGPLLWLGAIGTAQAADPLPSDEASLVRYALAHSPELDDARWARETADAGVMSASALASPIVRAEWLHAQSTPDYGFGVGLEWSPPAPGVFGARADAAGATARAVRADLEERAADVEASVRVAYAEISAQAQEAELRERSLATRRALRTVVETRLQHGAASRIDLSLAALGLARAEQERERARVRLGAERSRLEQLLGLPPDQAVSWPTLEPSGGIDEAAPARASSSDIAGLRQQALAARPLLRADNARAGAAEALVSAERAKRWPWLHLSVRYRQNDQSSYPNDFSVGVEISVPLPGQQAGPIAAREADLHREHALADRHRNDIQREVLEFESERARYAELAAHYAESVAPLLREHAALVQQALSGMALDAADVLAAEDMVTQGGIDYVQARLAERRAEIALERSLGRYGRGRPGVRP
jgi:outer membrane protein TolC